MSKIDYKALREAAEAAKGKTTWQKIQAFKAVARWSVRCVLS